MSARKRRERLLGAIPSSTSRRNPGGLSRAGRSWQNRLGVSSAVVIIPDRAYEIKTRTPREGGEFELPTGSRQPEIVPPFPDRVEDKPSLPDIPEISPDAFFKPSLADRPGILGDSIETQKNRDHQNPNLT